MGQRFVACDREQSFLMPPDVREWLSDDHVAWFVLEAVGQHPDLRDSPVDKHHSGMVVAARLPVCREDRRQRLDAGPRGRSIASTASSTNHAKWSSGNHSRTSGGIRNDCSRSHAMKRCAIPESS